MTATLTGADAGLFKIEKTGDDFHIVRFRAPSDYEALSQAQRDGGLDLSVVLTDRVGDQTKTGKHDLNVTVRDVTGPLAFRAMDLSRGNVGKFSLSHRDPQFKSRDIYIGATDSHAFSATLQGLESVNIFSGNQGTWIWTAGRYGRFSLAHGKISTSRDTEHLFLAYEPWVEFTAEINRALAAGHTLHDTIQLVTRTDDGASGIAEQTKTVYATVALGSVTLSEDAPAGFTGGGGLILETGLPTDGIAGLVRVFLAEGTIAAGGMKLGTIRMRAADGVMSDPAAAPTLSGADSDHYEIRRVTDPVSGNATFELWIRGGTVLDYESLPMGTEFTHNIEGAPTSYRNLPQLFIEGGAGVAPLIYDPNLSDVFDPVIGTPEVVARPYRIPERPHEYGINIIVKLAVTGVEAARPAFARLHLASAPSDLEAPIPVSADRADDWTGSHYSDLSPSWPRPASSYTTVQSDGNWILGEFLRRSIATERVSHIDGTRSYDLDFSTHYQSHLNPVFEGFRRLSANHMVYERVEFEFSETADFSSEIFSTSLLIPVQGRNDAPVPRNFDKTVATTDLHRIDLLDLVPDGKTLLTSLFHAPDPDRLVGGPGFEQWTHLRFLPPTVSEWIPDNYSLLDYLYRDNGALPDTRVTTSDLFTRSDLASLYVSLPIADLPYGGVPRAGYAVAWQVRDAHVPADGQPVYSNIGILRLGVVKGVMPDFTVRNFQLAPGADTIRAKEALLPLFAGNEDPGTLFDSITHIRVRLDQGVTLKQTEDGTNRPLLFRDIPAGQDMRGNMTDQIATPPYLDMTIDQFLSSPGLSQDQLDFAFLGGMDEFMKFHVSVDGGSTWSRQIIVFSGSQALLAAQYFDGESGRKGAVNERHLLVDDNGRTIATTPEWDSFIASKGWLDAKTFYGEAMTQHDTLSVAGDGRSGYKVWWEYGNARKTWVEVPRIELPDTLSVDAESGPGGYLYYLRMNVVGDSRLDTILFRDRPNLDVTKLAGDQIYGILDGYDGALAASDFTRPAGGAPDAPVAVRGAKVNNGVDRAGFGPGPARDILFSDIDGATAVFHVTPTWSVPTALPEPSAPPPAYVADADVIRGFDAGKIQGIQTYAVNMIEFNDFRYVERSERNLRIDYRVHDLVDSDGDGGRGTGEARDTVIYDIDSREVLVILEDFAGTLDADHFINLQVTIL